METQIANPSDFLTTLPPTLAVLALDPTHWIALTAAGEYRLTMDAELRLVGIEPIR